MLVGSCLQCRGASAIWFVNHWWHLTSSALISVWRCCMPGSWGTSTWCSVPDGGYLRRQKLKASWRRPLGRPFNVWLNKIQEPTLYCYLRCGDLRSPWVTERRSGHLEYATTMMVMMMTMGAGTGGAGWASAHPGKNQGGHGPPWKF